MSARTVSPVITRSSNDAPSRGPAWFRLQPKIDFNGENGCWTWIASRERNGYGIAWDGNRRKTTTAHRVVYECLIGPIPEDHDLHHKCENKSCVNPMHVEPATRAENQRASSQTIIYDQVRRTHCPQGHPYDEENTERRIGSGGRMRRFCKACRIERNRNRDRLLVRCGACAWKGARIAETACGPCPKCEAGIIAPIPRRVAA